MKAGFILAGALALAGCGAETARPATAYRPIPFPTGAQAGPAGVLGRDAAQLSALFGPPAADVREGPGRKLQFTNGTCVLDTYLYVRGRGEAIVTYVDAREPDGSPIDKASCVAALQKRR